MKNPIDQFFKDADEVRLSDESKGRLRERLIRNMKAQPVIRSPYQKLIGIISPYTIVFRRPALTLSVVLLVVVGGSVTAFAAVGSLPGDTLYPIKVDVIEPVRGFMAASPRAKAVWHASVIETRLNEVEELAKKDELTHESVEKSRERFDRSIQEAQLKIQEVSHSDPVAANEIDELLEESINSHEKVLKEVELLSSSTSAIEAGTFAKHIRKSLKHKLERDSQNSW